MIIISLSYSCVTSYMTSQWAQLSMELNDMLFSNESSSNETKIPESDAEVTTRPLVTLVILFGLPFGVLLVVAPSLTVIIILKSRKLKEIAI